MADLVLAEQAVEFGEIELGVVIGEKGLPVATRGQQAQPAQLEPTDLGQVAVLGEKLLDIGVAGAFQASGQLVVGEVRLQRVIPQYGGIATIRPAVAFLQRPLGFVVVATLLLQARGGSLEREGGDQQGQQEAGSRLRMKLPGQMERGTTGTSLACRPRQLNVLSAGRREKTTPPTNDIQAAT